MLGALPPLLLADASLRYGGRRELRRRGLVHWTLEAHQCDRGQRLERNRALPRDEPAAPSC